MAPMRKLLILCGVGTVLSIASNATSQAPNVIVHDSYRTETQTQGGPSPLRRLSDTQYVRSIQAVFGDDIKVPGRFDPPLRSNGLMAIGDGRAAISTAGIEQSELRARQIAAQVVAEDKRNRILSCSPANGGMFDAECASTFFAKYGRLLYRRPLSDSELAGVMALAANTAGKAGDFHKGVEVGLIRMLVSPHFLFRVERSELDPEQPDTRRLDDYSLATRISFLLWNAPPDDELLDAAASGALRKQAGIDAQVERLIASSKFVDGTRAFFSDMLGYEQFSNLAKDQALFPKFTSQLAADAREQTLLTLVDLLVKHNGDYRDIFTTRDTFINRNLGALYRVPVSGEAVEGWTAYRFDGGSSRAGILSLAAFLMLDPTHEGRSSPTMRGKIVREQLLCEEVPPPPANVNFSLVQDTDSPEHRTARDRLRLHSEDPSCAGCHKLTDPIGLSMENYDASGAWRTHENGAQIDPSGEFEGRTYDHLMELTLLLRESPAVPLCAVQRAFEYGAGRQITDSEGSFIEQANEGFAADGYSFRALMRRIATSRAIRAVSTAPQAIAMAER